MAEIFSEELNQKLIDNYIGDPDFQKLCSDEIDRIFYAGGTNEPSSASNDNGTDDSFKGIARLYQERKNTLKSRTIINSNLFNGFTKEKYCKFTNCKHIEVQI